VQIDTEVRRILMEAYEGAKLLLRRNVEVLHKMAEALLEREVIDGAEIDQIVEQYGNQNGGLRGAAAATA
jgi:cell division protease FtsH